MNVRDKCRIAQSFWEIRDWNLQYRRGLLEDSLLLCCETGTILLVILRSFGPRYLCGDI